MGGGDLLAEIDSFDLFSGKVGPGGEVLRFFAADGGRWEEGFCFQEEGSTVLLEFGEGVAFDAGGREGLLAAAGGFDGREGLVEATAFLDGGFGWHCDVFREYC